MKKLLLTVLGLVVTTSLWAAQGTVYTATDSKSGNIKWRSRSKTYQVDYKNGTTTVTAEYPADEVERLDIPKPANLDKAIGMISAGQDAGAIPLLQAIVDDYVMLKWDKIAGNYLVNAYLKVNNPKKAFEVAQKMINEDKSAAYTGELAPAYWKALLKLNKDTQLENCLKKAASSGDRPSAAAACTMRGDIILASANETNELLRQALTEGYLRTILMYNDASCAETRREALLKAATCFDKLGQATRAETLRNQAK